MTFECFELPPSLVEWIGAGRHPSELLGARWRVHLLDDLIALDWLTPDERQTQARKEMSWAEYLASGASSPDTALYRTLEARQHAARSSRWTHDLLADPAAPRALLGILDAIEAMSIEIEADRLKRPAPLEAHESNGERCASCGELEPPGTPMLTFDARHDRFSDESPPSEVEQMMRGTAAGQELYADEEHSYTSWRWCQACVVTSLNL